MYIKFGGGGGGPTPLNTPEYLAQSKYFPIVLLNVLAMSSAKSMIFPFNSSANSANLLEKLGIMLLRTLNLVVLVY